MHYKPDVRLNDQISIPAIEQYDKIILSPGPGIPSEAGLLLSVIERYASSKSILGVCLGQQAIGEVFGATLFNLPDVFHGVSTPVHLHETSKGLFKGLHATEMVGRYHSWVVSRDSLPSSLQVTATDEDGYIMGLRHNRYDVQGVQFHPESVLTPCGETILRNWLLND